MWGLIYKDLVSNKKNLLLCYGCTVFYGIMFMFFPFIVGDEAEGMEQANQVFSAIVIILAYVMTGEAFQGSIFLNDEHKKWAYYISSTPYGAVGQVQAKYWVILVTTFATNLLCIFIDSIFGVVHIGTGSQIFLIYIATAILLFLRAIEIPFIIRYGSKQGIWVKSIFFFVLVFGAIVYALFGDLSYFGSTDDFWEWYFSIINGEGISDGLMLFIGIFPLVTMALFYGSYKLSCRFYLKGAENFED